MKQASKPAVTEGSK